LDDTGLVSGKSWILHVDLDQFVAAVEIRRRPELRGRPVVVGGSGDPMARRQVVATASYEARAFGVRSGMPLRVAARRCPEAVFLPADGEAYAAASDEVMAVLRGFPVVVEVYGWDEAFLGARTADPEGLARQVQQAVADVTGLSCSIGIGDTKQRAKLAVASAKPAGVHLLPGESWMDLMAERPTQALWGVGPRLAARLAEAGLHTVGELAAADPAWLAARFGPTLGPYYREVALGGPFDPVSDEPREPKSRSQQLTYPEDLVERAAIESEVVRLARELTSGAAESGFQVARVSVTVRFAPYLTKTKISKLPSPSTSPDAVAEAALRVLARFDLARPVRLLGVRVEYAEGRPASGTPPAASRPSATG
jgi:DNA polymerase IV